MEILMENKSKKLAFTFTVGIHLLLFLFFLLTGFIAPNTINANHVDIKGEFSMAGYELIEIDAMIPSSSSPSYAKLISDPNETDFKLEKMKPISTLDSTTIFTDSEYQTVLKKWSGRKKSVGQIKKSAGNELESTHEDNKEGKDNFRETSETFSLTNRSLLQKPEVILNSTDEGKVVVEIIVDENGKVTSALPGQRGSTTTSRVLYERAVNAAYTAKFNSSKEGIKEQRGTYTFVFTLE